MNAAKLGLSGPLRSIYGMQVLRQLGISLAEFFGVMFVYELTGSLGVTFAVYITLYAAYGALIPWVAKLYGHISRRLMMTIGITALALSYVPFILFADRVWLMLFLYLSLQVVFFLYYWLPYQVTIAQMMKSETRGRVMGILNTFSSIALGVTPFLGGVLIEKFSFAVMFWVGVALILLSIIPLAKLPHYQHDHFDYGYRDAFRLFRLRIHRRLILAHAGAGFNHAARVVVWPIFIYLLFEGEFETIGLISTFSLFVVIILRLFTGKLLDAPKTKKLMVHWTSRAQALTWLFRAFPVTAIQVVVADTAYKLVESMNNLSYDKEVYDHIDQHHDRADEYIVIRAIAINMGRVILLLLGLLVAVTLGIRFVFVLAALGTLLMNRVQKEHTV